MKSGCVSWRLLFFLKMRLKALDLSQIFAKFATKPKLTMPKSIEIQLLEKIKCNPKGTIYFVDSFVAIANAKAVNKALERLVKSGELERIAQGIYVHPVIDDYIGKVLPSIEEVAAAIAKRDRATIVPVPRSA
jgi:hypothetical protein